MGKEDFLSLDDLHSNFSQERPTKKDEDEISVSSSGSRGNTFPNLTMPRPRNGNGMRFHGRFEKGLLGTQRWLRWPLLVLIMLTIILELLLYTSLRSFISLWEILVDCVCRRHSDEVSHLRKVRSFREWEEAATRLDSLEGADFWKTVDQSPFYDWKSVQNMIKILDNELSDVKLCEVLSRVFNFNVSAFGLDNEPLFSEARCGTKLLLHRFVEKLVEAIRRIRDSSQLSDEEKIALFTRYRRVFGRSALCLSSGATMSYYHFGVVKALLDENLLPDVICGSSGGALVAAMISTRTEQELRLFLNEDLHHHLRPCDESWSTLLLRYWNEKQLFDAKRFRSLLRKCLFCDMTFAEAFAKTGRVLNIACTNSRRNGAPILLNHLSTPTVVIWSAVIASSAVPPFLRPIRLVCKTVAGKIVPFTDYGMCWSDGAIKADIPAKLLSEQHNANYLIVCQVNPHVAPFFFENRGSSGLPSRRWGSAFRGGFISSALEMLLKLEMKKWLRLLQELDLMPEIMSVDFSELFLQRMTGDVTMHPSRGWLYISDFFQLLSNPSPSRMRHYLSKGQRVCWPKINRIRMRLQLEHTLRDALHEVSAAEQVPI